MAYVRNDFEETYKIRSAIRERAVCLLNFSIALPAIVVVLPIMTIIAIIIKLDSPGPVIFKQKRIGRNWRNGVGGSFSNSQKNGDRRREDLGGRPFEFYKFRTMIVDAKEKYPELYKYEYTEEEIKTMYFKISDDPRLTRFGARLRKTTLDELPNLFNVLKCEMNMIGPRPDIPEMVKYYTRRQRKKFEAKPGITGLSQANGRGLLTFQKTLELDVEYVEKRSIWLNIRIILKTIKATIRRQGAF